MARLDFKGKIVRRRLRASTHVSEHTFKETTQWSDRVMESRRFAICVGAPAKSEQSITFSVTCRISFTVRTLKSSRYREGVFRYCGYAARQVGVRSGTRRRGVAMVERRLLRLRDRVRGHIGKPRRWRNSPARRSVPILDSQTDI